VREEITAEIQGDRTGRRWRYHPTVDVVRSHGGRTYGERYRARAADDHSLACVHRLEKGTHWDDEVAALRVAIAVAGRPEIVAAPTIRQLIDVRETEAVTGEFGYPGSLDAIWEWGDISLDDFLHRPDEDSVVVAAAVETNVGAALDVIHRIGLVHSDVVPNNIFRVDGAWKLGDLNGCVERDSRMTHHPKDERFLHPDRLNRPVQARDEFDLYGLEQVLVALRSR
jgi:hypothetical protein